MRRYEIINYLIQKHSYTKYLEIGVGSGGCFNKIKCETKHSVDPSYTATFNMTSDVFFKKLSKENKYDIIFIDGDHTKRAVSRDINNCLKHLNDGGIILVHDVNPSSPRLARKKPKENHPTWYGDGYKAILNLRSTRLDLLVRVIDTDCGVGVIKPVEEKQTLVKIDSMTYATMDKNRRKTLGLISVEEFMKMDL